MALIFTETHRAIIESRKGPRSCKLSCIYFLFVGFFVEIGPYHLRRLRIWKLSVSTGLKLKLEKKGKQNKKTWRRKYAEHKRNTPVIPSSGILKEETAKFEASVGHLGETLYKNKV